MAQKWVNPNDVTCRSHYVNATSIWNDLLCISGEYLTKYKEESLLSLRSNVRDIEANEVCKLNTVFFFQIVDQLPPKSVMPYFFLII